MRSESVLLDIASSTERSCDCYNEVMRVAQHKSFSSFHYPRNKIKMLRNLVLFVTVLPLGRVTAATKHRTVDPFPLLENLDAYAQKVKSPPTLSPRRATPQNCNSLPGLWTGGYGATCGESPLGDSYLFNWTIPAQPGAWTATLESGGGWGTGSAQNSPDNTTTIITLDTGLTLHGNISSTTEYGECSCIQWDNGSWWMKAMQPSTITDVHIIAMNHLGEF